MLSLILLLAAIIVVCCHAYKMVPSIHNNVLRTYSSRRASTNFRLHLFGNPEPPKTNSDKKEGGGLFGGMGNMIENVKKAQEIAKQAEVVQRDLGTVLLYSLLNALSLVLSIHRLHLQSWCYHPLSSLNPSACNVLQLLLLPFQRVQWSMVLIPPEQW